MKKDINGINLHFHTWGDPGKPLLLFLHGWLDTGANFEWTCHFLKDEFYCVAPDLRGCGLSDHTTNPLGYYFYDYIADVHQILNYFGAGETDVYCVGHSMGANIMSLYAGGFPQRIKKFVNIEGLGIMDMPADQGPDRVTKWINGVLGEEREQRKYTGWQVLAKSLIKSSRRLTMDSAEPIAKNLLRYDGTHWILRGHHLHQMPGPYLFRVEHIIAFWQKITADVLYIQGEDTVMAKWMSHPGQEKKTLDEIVDERLSHYPKQTRRLTLKECGHMIHYEAPEQLATAIKRFLK